MLDTISVGRAKEKNSEKVVLKGEKMMDGEQLVSNEETTRQIPAQVEQAGHDIDALGTAIGLLEERLFSVLRGDKLKGGSDSHREEVLAPLAIEVQDICFKMRDVRFIIESIMDRLEL